MSNRTDLVQAVRDAEIALAEFDLAEAIKELEDAKADCTCDPHAGRYEPTCWVAEAANRRDEAARTLQALTG